MSYEFEFDITHLLNELLRTPLRETGERGTTEERESTQRSTGERESTQRRETGERETTSRERRTGERESTIRGTTERPNIQDTSSVFITMMQRNQNMLDELIYQYNIQMDRYNQNIERLIQVLQSNQTRVHQYLTQPTTTTMPLGPSTFSHQRRNAIREDAGLIRTMLNNPLYRISPTTSLIYSYLYPTAQQQQQQRQRTTITQSQIQNAIDSVIYDSSTMQNNTCPISLLAFTQGEEVSQIRHCRHIFKPDSLNQWLTHYSSCCPVCRYDIRDYVREPQYDDSESSDDASSDDA